MELLTIQHEMDIIYVRIRPKFGLFCIVITVQQRRKHIVSTDIRGWVEIKRNDRRDIWLGVVNIFNIMNRNYLMFDFLFGGRSENYAEAIAPLRRLKETEVSLQAASGGNYESWIGLDELLAIDWMQHQNIFSTDWQRLIQIMKILAEDERVTDVRLIVGFF